MCILWGAVLWSWWFHSTARKGGDGDGRGRDIELRKLSCLYTNIHYSIYKATKVIAEFCSNYGNTITLLSLEMQNATLLEVPSEWSFGDWKYVDLIFFFFFFRVAPENPKICVQLPMFKTDQVFPDSLLTWVCGILHICVGGKCFPALKTHTPWHIVRLPQRSGLLF